MSALAQAGRALDDDDRPIDIAVGAEEKVVDGGRRVVGQDEVVAMEQLGSVLGDGQLTGLELVEELLDVLQDSWADVPLRASSSCSSTTTTTTGRWPLHERGAAWQENTKQAGGEGGPRPGGEWGRLWLGMLVGPGGAYCSAEQRTQACALGLPADEGQRAPHHVADRQFAWAGSRKLGVEDKHRANEAVDRGGLVGGDQAEQELGGCHSGGGGDADGATLEHTAEPVSTGAGDGLRNGKRHSAKRSAERTGWKLFSR